MPWVKHVKPDLSFLNGNLDLMAVASVALASVTKGPLMDAWGDGHAALSYLIHALEHEDLIVFSVALSSSRQDGSADEDPSWSCSTGDVCEIVYDLVSPQSIEQIRIGECGKPATRVEWGQELMPPEYRAQLGSEITVTFD